MKKVALHTLGCKLNFSETSTIGNEFLKQGFTIVDFKKSADIYVLNTCTVTENAEKDCRQIVRRILRQNPDAYIIVTGCYAQLRPQEIAAIDGVDLILGSNEKFNLFSYTSGFEKNELACIYVSPTDKLNEFGPAFSTDADSRTRAFLKIQDGCDYKCSFCTIPLARGLSRSSSPDEVIKHFSQLVSNGYKEIVLTGVNVGDYGKSYNKNLYHLLLDLIKIPGEFRIRISSIEPNLITDEIIGLIASSEKMCNHLHIPLQSGSNTILRAMQRRYRTSVYSDVIEKAVSKINDVGIGVDVIVGFPGETEEHFIETHNFIRELPVSYLHVFTYSERPDTSAISIKEKVDVAERKRRNHILRILSEKKRKEFYSKMGGKTFDVLFEGENYDGMIKGFASNYLKVAIPYDNSIVNSIQEVEITSSTTNICSGVIKGEKKSIELVA